MTLSFTTSRLNVVEVDAHMPSDERAQLLACVPQILTPTVVAALPPYFHDVNSLAAAEVWLEQMLAQSRLLRVQTNVNEVIGFLFIHMADNVAHIGYVLGQASWGKGLATELLQGLMIEARKTPWHKLVGGVDQGNLASTKLLKKLGFVAQEADDNGVIMFEYVLP
ncbi:GNAT family N-acetyltransferase [Motilimonas eburnea]|uniref:GNAT family N-acetyltransferase n=1 Tax=Motilimonas eburnea TaxID=1737488 RepID=UPI001E5C4CFD|nr:GNAT family N-acetyltransferase [Motilimonas eburnea]MCE2571185.1 GNAT family N-acetyltransferase [Motilimonas eburnea]